MARSLKKAQVDVAKRLLKKGQTQREVAGKLGVSQATISFAVRRLGAYA